MTDNQPKIPPEEGPVPKFEVGDKVRMPGVPFVVEVLEFGTCDEHGHNTGETFRFKDPESGEDDWMRTSDFEKAP